MKIMYHLYILQCTDDTLYTGIARDLTRRIEEHNSSHLGAKYTRSRRPVRLIFSQEFSDRSSALKEECRIKKLPRAKKFEVINSHKIDS